jgi:hypothetical protein
LFDGVFEFSAHLVVAKLVKKKYAILANCGNLYVIPLPKKFNLTGISWSKPGRSVAEKPSESGNNTHFQRHSLPGPYFGAEKAFSALFSRNFPLGMAFLLFLAIFSVTCHPPT